MIMQQLGDCLGKGAFGSVYRALDWGTGETVAVKRVKLANLPKSELRVIMLEIDLLKNLNHPNIVKYKGFVKSEESLDIILEYCENGSLHSICKHFGKFPENLVALYMSQVLHGLLYLHEQGVIHRDIKGANILTTKEGLVKLADFGVATKATGLHEASVVGTPYWMAPEVIELSGATTASDIWSLGCTVIELLDGKPPYHKLAPMPALFRIVNDDHPPMPESLTPAVQDFLMQCFQKDPNLRVSARKLLKHPWIVAAKRADSGVTTKTTKYDEAVKEVQQWNEALKSPENTVRRDSRGNSASPIPPRQMDLGLKLDTIAPTAKTQLETVNPRGIPDAYRSPETSSNENWDDDFASSISSSALQLPHHKPIDNFAGMLSSDKLKAFATRQISAEQDKWDDDFPSEVTGKLPHVNAKDDPNKTVQAESPAKARIPKHKSDSPVKISQRLPSQRHVSQPKTQILRGPEISSHTPPRPSAPKRSSSIFREKSIEDYSDLVTDDGIGLEQRLRQVLKTKQDETNSSKSTPVSDLKRPRKPRQSQAGGSLRGTAGHDLDVDEIALRRSRSSVEIQKYAENYEDEDFSDIFGAGTDSLMRQTSDSGSDQIISMLNTKVSSNSWLGDEDEDEEEDPFAQLEENLDEMMDMDTKVARDRHARLSTMVENLVSSLKTNQDEDVLEDVSDQLLQVLCESPDLKSVVVSSHGLLPILEVLDNCQRRDISLILLRIINLIIFENVEIQENFCFVGGIPVVTKFAHKKYSSDIRLQAAAFVRQMYQTSTLTLQMFISCGGLNVLVEFLEEDYEAERDLVLVGVNGVWSVFELQGPTPKNDFCRIFSRSSVLYPLSLVLNRVLDERGEVAELVEGRIVNIFLLFSQAENHVKESIADRMVLKRVLKDLRRMSPKHQITMLKFIKNLSMLATTLDALQNSNAIETLTDLLGSSTKLEHHQEIENQVMNIMFNLCRLSKNRQEDAALNGIVPLLQGIAKNKRSTKEFAIPILCDMAYSGKVGRKILWQNKALDTYVRLVADADGYWQVTALDAIFVWLQEETAKVEEHLLSGPFSSAIPHCFLDSKADAFENLLEPLQKILRLSPPIAATLAHPDLFSRTSQKLTNKKAVVRVNLLRIIRSICDASEEQGALIRRYGLFDAVQNLADADPAVLVRNMAQELIKSSDALLNRQSIDGAGNPRYRPFRRTSSSTMTPPALYSTSQPPTPQGHNHTRSSVSRDYFDRANGGEQFHHVIGNRGSRSSLTPASFHRPISRDGTPMSNLGHKFGSGLDFPSSATAASIAAERSNTSTPVGTLGAAGPVGTNGSAAVKSRLPRTQSTRLGHTSRSSLAPGFTPGSAGSRRGIAGDDTTPTPSIRESRLGREKRETASNGAGSGPLNPGRRRRQTSGG
ncbi:hypothetical protein FH972_025917 [Carpinus fangiana]|uniref:non-specific serine/threonine protein kinase n=1 Tax=Carpinus fangiana TaxID=176857 RepID=A0A5N6L2I2_9ROSI|nr:hypothetical protein FH972_025917 [Carpinus fangiana]